MYSVQTAALKRETAQNIITLAQFYSFLIFFFFFINLYQMFTAPPICGTPCSEPVGLRRCLNSGRLRWATFASPCYLNSFSLSCCSFLVVLLLVCLLHTTVCVFSWTPLEASRMEDKQVFQIKVKETNQTRISDCPVFTGHMTFWVRRRQRLIIQSRDI